MKKSGIIIVVFMMAFCFLGPLFSPYIPNSTNLNIGGAPISFSHPLGTDRVGRDVLTLMMTGGQISLVVGFFTAAIASFIGVLIGVVAGYLGGKVDNGLMMVTDFALCIPVISVVLLISSIAFDFELTSFAKLILLIVTLGGFLWPQMARLIRSRTIVIKTDDHVIEAKLMNLKTSHIIIKHIMPKLKRTILSNVSILVGDAILVESSLSFLGIGAGITYPTWGSLISQATDFYIFKNYPNVWLSAGLFIALTLTGFHMIGVENNAIDKL